MNVFDVESKLIVTCNATWVFICRSVVYKPLINK